MKSALLVSIALLPALAWADPRNPKPDWVDGSSMEYPREKFIVGIGFADDRPTAEDRARAEISKVFSTVVTVNTDTNASETTQTKGKKEEVSFSQSVSQNLKTASSKALADVSIAETWQDKAAQRYYALAVLDRSKGTTSLKDKIADIDKESLEWKDKLDKASDRLPKVRYGMKLLALLKARSSLNDELRVLDADGKGLPPALDEAAVRPQAAKALSELNVELELSGKGADRLRTGVMKGLSASGLGAKAGKSDAVDIRIEGSVESEPLYEGQKKEGAFWIRSSATLALKDVKTDTTFLQFEASDREAATSASEASRWSLDELAKSVAEKTQEAIHSYFENQ